METETATIAIHTPDIKEKIFFLLSGLLVSVPFTLFLSDLSDSLCIAMPLLFAQVCSLVLFAPLIEEFAKVFPLFYRHGETERSIFSREVGSSTGNERAYSVENSLKNLEGLLISLALKPRALPLRKRYFSLLVIAT